MSNFNPIVMRQFYALLCLLLFSGACSEDDTPNPAVKFSSPDSDVKISQDGTSAAITAAISIMNGESVIGKITVEQGVAPTLSLESNTAEFTNEGGGN